MFFCLLDTSVRTAYTYTQRLRGLYTHWWKVAGEQVFAGTSPGPARSMAPIGSCGRNSKVDHHRCMIVELTIMISWAWQQRLLVLHTAC